ncbi:MAG: hypothetical protein M0C28_21620 [Candidatus Moduliflexus flocculans]|nr:hypothetical protein [Candidatus Moduliflexus flocculans]
MAIFALASHRIHFLLGDRNMILLFIGLILAGYFGLGLVGGVGGFLFYYLLTSMRGMRGPMFLNYTQVETPSANRASILSLQSLAFRITFIVTGPLVRNAGRQNGCTASLSPAPLCFFCLSSRRSPFSFCVNLGQGGESALPEETATEPECSVNEDSQSAEVPCRRLRPSPRWGFSGCLHPVPVLRFFQPG